MGLPNQRVKDINSLVLNKLVARVFKGSGPVASEPAASFSAESIKSLGLIAGNGPFPIRFVAEAKRAGWSVTAVCHLDETDPALESIVDKAVWIRVGQLGTMLRTFREAGVSSVAMAGGISRVKHFGDVKLDAKGAALLLRLRSTKDDVIMRGIAEEVEKVGIPVIPCTSFLQDCLVPEGRLTKGKVSDSELEDIQVGRDAIAAMGAQDIGQVVVVRKGVIVAVEAVEGTDAAIQRGGNLSGAGSVVVKCAKPTQDMRFDVPTVGLKTLQTMVEARCRVLSLEAGRTLLLDRVDVIRFAELHGIAVIGSPPLILP